jgi:hypothetical protein
MGVTIRELFNDHLKMHFVCYLKSYLLEMVLGMTLPALLLSARTVQIASCLHANLPDFTHRKPCLSSPIKFDLNLMTLNLFHHPNPPVSPSGAWFKPAPVSSIKNIHNIKKTAWREDLSPGKARTSDLPIVCK